MQLERRAEVAAIVKEMNAGVADAYVRWFDIAEAPVRSIVFKAISETGIWVDRDRRHDIVHDAILDLAAVTCRSWSTTGGALPWQWAKSRIRGLAHQGIGFVADDLDRHGDAQESVEVLHPQLDERVGRDVLAELDHPVARLLAGALDRRVPKRSQNIWLEVEMEKQAGNRAPAPTVAARHGLSEANVRQICRRVRLALHKEANTEGDLGILLELPCLAA